MCSFIRKKNHQAISIIIVISIGSNETGVKKFSGEILTNVQNFLHLNKARYWNKNANYSGPVEFCVILLTKEEDIEK